jgi:hypothetical protein
MQAVLIGWVMQRTGHVIAPAVYRAFSAWMAYF